MAKCDRLLTSGISREKEIVRLTTPKKDVNNMEWKTSWSPTEIFSQLKLKNLRVPRLRKLSAGMKENRISAGKKNIIVLRM